MQVKQALEASAAAHHRIDPKSVVGWGVDANPENDPTYPMRDRSKESKGGMDWPVPVPQEPRVEILQSVEHVKRPSVVGTSTPPRGLSGAIRRAAFKYSESQWAHWLMLIFADRVNVVEGNLRDLTRGRLPNHWREMGISASWKHDKSRVVIRAAIGVVIVGAVVAGVAVLLSQD
ncbi:MAG TPA: hypothetical protein VF699_05680 [Caulobacteraceae bacterium]|jgi:hypothetical protein